MSPTARVLVVAMVTSVVVGFLTVPVIVLVDEPAATIRHSLLTVEGMLSLLFIGAFTSLPISVPAGIAGGALAARIVATQRAHRSLTSWVGRGAACGALIGAVGTVVLFALPSIATDTASLLLLMMAVIGGAAGGVVGAVVGAYCSRAFRVSGGRDAETDEPALLRLGGGRR